AGRTPRATRPPSPRARTRRLALDLLPPIVTRAVRRYLAARRTKAGRPGQSRP
ncbi:class I SAM-dependent methyltransferase, partial [Streptomyces sp. SID5789]|nr:class I SAM-dependent methyltransferase [Streptomyces sp. SID5789]